MLEFTLRRMAALIPVLLGVTVITFLMISVLPGNTAQAILGTFASPENVRELAAALGLDRPLHEQFFVWLGNVLQGDLGRSYVLHRPVLNEIADRIGPTLLLAGTALLLSTGLGLLLGVVAAVRQGQWQDRLVTLVVLVGISTPSFWLGLLLIAVFAVRYGWFPVGGMADLFGAGGFLDVAWHLALPAATLAAVATAVLVRLTRTSMLEVLRQDFVRTARAKGLSERRVILRHAFANALAVVLPVIGLEASFVLGGAVYVETIFQWPGVGRMLVNAIATRDVLLVQGGVLVIAVAYVFINLATDLAQGALDPRIRRA